MRLGKGRMDIVLNALCLFVLIGISVYLAVTWRGIPEFVPIHYDSSGAVDNYAAKNALITLLLTSWAMYVLFTAVQFIPKSMWNTGFAVTEDEREQVFVLSVHLLNSVKLIIILLFAYCIITSAAASGFSGWCVFAFIAAALGSLFYWLGRIINVGKG